MLRWFRKFFQHPKPIVAPMPLVSPMSILRRVVAPLSSSDALDLLVTQNPTADTATILSLATSDVRTILPIIASDLQKWMAINGRSERLRRTSTAMLSNGDVSDSDQLASFVSDAVSGTMNFDTTDPAEATLVDAMRATLVALNTSSPTLGISDDEVTSFVMLGGGYLLKNTTIDDVTTSITRVADVAAKAALSAQYMALEQLAFARWNIPNNLWNKESAKIQAMLIAGTACPVDLAALDALITGGG